MTEPAIDNGRATIREVYALVSELRADLATIDGKVDALHANEVHLAVIERTCADRPSVCRLQTDRAIRAATEQHSERGWTQLQRFGWVIATIVATTSAVINWIY